MVLASFGNPYFLSQLPQSRAYVCAYGEDSPSIEQTARVLFGEDEPRGALPVTIPGLAAFGASLRYAPPAAPAEITDFACFVSLTEVQYIVTYKRGGQAAAETLAELQALPVAWVHSDDALCANAAEIKALHRLSLADAFVAAAALRQDAVLVHRDAEFAPLAASVSQELLPPKTSVAASS